MSRVILNLFDDPKLSEREFVTEGDFVYARGRAEEFDLTKNKKYEILDTNGYELIKVMKNSGEPDWFSVEYFSKYESM